MSDVAVIVNALGWTLIHFLWQGILVASLMWLLFRLIPQQRSQLRYLASLGLYFLLLPVSINTFIFFLKSSAATLAVMSLNLPLVNVAAGVKPGLDFWLNEGIEPLLPLVVFLWVLGVSILALRTLIGWAGTRFLVSRNVEPIPSGMQARVNGLIDRLQVSQAVAVLVSSRVKVPTVIGWIKPVILLPASIMARMPAQQLEMIIAHELGHIHRYDYLVNLLQVVIDTLFFYHPQVRWMSRCIRQEREHCCDDYVLKHECQPKVYARALANLEILRQPANATALAATGGDLLHRVHRIANSELPRKSAGFAQIAMMAMLVAVAGMGARSGFETGVQSSGDWSSGVLANEQFSFSGSIARPVGWRPGSDPYGQIRQGIESNKRKNEASAMEQLVTIEERPLQKQSFGPAPKTGPQVRTYKEPVALHDLELASLNLVGHDVIDIPEPVLESHGNEIDSQDSAFQSPPRMATVRPVKTVKPRYPIYARSRAVEGWVKLSFTVDESGKAKAIRVVAASPAQIFDGVAEKALRKWKFKVLEGHDTGSLLLQAFEFSMNPSAARPTTRERRCNKTGSNICGVAYRQENVEIYGAQKIRMEAANRNLTSQQTHRHTNSK